MALIAMVEATVTYACRLSEEDEEKVYEYVRDTDISIKDAIAELYWDQKIDLYKNSTESDFDTKCIVNYEREE